MQKRIAITFAQQQSKTAPGMVETASCNDVYFNEPYKYCLNRLEGLAGER
jgi:hypothetical protein